MYVQFNPHERELLAESVQSSSAVNSIIECFESLRLFDWSATSGTDTSTTTALVSEEMNNAELETPIPMIAVTFDTPAARDVDREVVGSAHSSGVVKSAASDSCTTARIMKQ